MHENFNQTLKPAYGDTVNPEDVVVEGGIVKNRRERKRAERLFFCAGIHE